MKQRATLKDTVRRLKEAGIDMPVLDARLLVEHALKTDWATLFTGADRELTSDEAALLEANVLRRLGHEPISRIVGKRGFWKFDLAISPATLDPRADTETLVMAILKETPDLTAPLRILDLGTGSGAILLALLSEMPHATGLGIDISEEACAMAEANALALGLQNRATFRAENWEATTGIGFDIVVSNPPYIPTAEIAGLEIDVRDYDPHAALDGGPDGLAAYRSLAARVGLWLKPDGLLALEIGQNQARDVETLFAETVPYFKRWQDLGGIQRALTARPL